MRKPLYLIRTDAVLIHPSLPGFPILNPPLMAAKTTSAHTQFTVATALAPISWPDVLGWYGIKQPQRNHVWPLRALLHIYLMLSLRHVVGEQGGASQEFILNCPTVGYQTLLDSGAHYVGNFWPRTPEMLMLALSKAKEPMVPVILHALMSTALANDAAHAWRASEDFSHQITLLVNQLQSALDTPDAASGADALALIGVTRRRAGVIERALIHTLRQASPNPTATLALPRPLMMKTPANRLATAHHTSTKHTLGTNLDVLFAAPPRSNAR